MNIQTKMNIWNTIISTYKKTAIEYEDLIKASFESCRDEIFNIEDEKGNTPLSLAQGAGNDFLINVILSNGGHNLSYYPHASSLSSNSEAVLVQPKQRLSKEEFVELCGNEVAIAFKNRVTSSAVTMILRALNKAFNKDYPAGIDIFAQDYECNVRFQKLEPLLWAMHSAFNKKFISGNMYLFKDQINYQDPYYGSTFLMTVVSKNNLDLVKEIIENGADLTIKNKSNYTALDFAKKAKATEIVELLKQAMGINNQAPAIIGAKRVREESSASSSSSSASASSSSAVVTIQSKQTFSKEEFVELSKKLVAASFRNLTNKNLTEDQLRALERMNTAFNIDHPAGIDIFAAGYANQLGVIISALKFSYFAIAREMIAKRTDLLENNEGATILYVAKAIPGAAHLVKLVEQKMGVNVSSTADPAANLNTSSSSSSAGTFVARLNQQNLEAQGTVVNTKKAKKDDESSSMDSASSWKDRSKNQQNNNDLSK